MPIFRVKSVKIYTVQKNLHRRRPWRLWQIWGMIWPRKWAECCCPMIISAPLLSSLIFGSVEGKNWGHWSFSFVTFDQVQGNLIFLSPQWLNMTTASKNEYFIVWHPDVLKLDSGCSRAKFPDIHWVISFLNPNLFRNDFPAELITCTQFKEEKP